jgi:hypothetical protein
VSHDGVWGKYAALALDLESLVLVLVFFCNVLCFVFWGGGMNVKANECSPHITTHTVCHAMIAWHAWNVVTYV